MNVTCLYNGWTFKVDNDVPCDNFIARYLDIDINSYIQILKDHNAQSIDNEYYFQSQEDAELCLKFLEPYLIMKELTE
jgi:hypothetical protein